MRTSTEIEHHPPLPPYLGLPRHVPATASSGTANDVVWQLPGGHLSAEVGVLSDTRATAEDDGCGADLGDEVAVEEVTKYGGLATNRRKGILRTTLIEN